MKTLKFNLTKTDITKAKKLAEKYEQEPPDIKSVNWCTICIIAVVIRKKIPDAWVGSSTLTNGPAYKAKCRIWLPQTVIDIIRLWDLKYRDQVVPMSFTLEVPDDF